MFELLRTGYITDDFSTLGGLASVAYGDPEYFREVQNQIYFQSPTRFLDVQRPSDIFESFFGSREAFTEALLEGLESQYQSDGQFRDYVDVRFGADWREKISPDLQNRFFGNLDSLEGYGLSLSDYVEFVVEELLPGAPASGSVVDSIVDEVRSNPLVGSDSSLIAKAVSNNPQTKLSVPPSSTRIDLNNSVDLGYDYRGIDIPSGYLTPQDYWSDVAYPGMTNQVTPTGFKDFISNGYVGYLSSTPLEGLFNPIGAQSISDAPGSTSDPASLSNPSVFSQFPEELQADRDVFSISLMGERLNGYTTFDPSTMSNGDLLNTSQVPSFDEDNKDPEGGLNPTARNFTPAF